MKLFFQHLDDPHHKVAQAALSTLADIVPACRKPFEGYMERMLPHVFSRSIDPKEVVRQPCSATLEIVSQTCSIDVIQHWKLLAKLTVSFLSYLHCYEQ